MPRPAAERFPALARLCGAYLHEDLRVTDGTVEAAVARFAREVAPEVRRRCAHEVSRLLAATRGERALDALLAELGASERPRGGRRAARAWLEQVRRRLCAAG